MDVHATFLFTHGCRDTIQRRERIKQQAQDEQKTSSSGVPALRKRRLRFYEAYAWDISYASAKGFHELGSTLSLKKFFGLGRSVAQHNVLQNSVVQSSAVQCGAEQYTYSTSVASKQAPLAAPRAGVRVEGAQPTLRAAIQERLPSD